MWTSGFLGATSRHAYTPAAHIRTTFRGTQSSKGRSDIENAYDLESNYEKERQCTLN